MTKEQDTQEDTQRELQRYRQNWQKEIDGGALYQALSEAAARPEMKDVYLKLAQSEGKHAAYWAGLLAEAGQRLPVARPSWRARTLAWLARRFGPQFVLPTVAGNERADSQAYAGQAYAGQAGEAVRQMSADEKSHARLVSAAAEEKSGGLAGSVVAQMEGRHKSAGGNALRAAVLGANDGLVSNLSLVMGVAGAAVSGQGILITGLAGLLAGSCSMALGEWLSVQSSRELYQRQIQIEKQELEAHPEEEQEELALIYQSKGLPKDRAEELAGHIINSSGSALDTLSREELGIDPQELGGSPWEAAITSFFLFAAGAIAPVLSFIFLRGTPAVVVSITVSALGLFLIGGAITLMTGRSVLYSGMRMVIVGLAAAALTYGIGRLIGGSIGG
jgi:vacuolar iron transporter family protein